MKAQSLLRFTTELHLNTSSELKKINPLFVVEKYKQTHKMTVRRKQSNFPFSRYMNCIAPNLKKAHSLIHGWYQILFEKKVFGFRLSL